MEGRIILCEITNMGFVNEVDVMYDNGLIETVFKYYPDELSFNRREFIGLTKEEALELYGHKDIAYQKIYEKCYYYRSYGCCIYTWSLLR